MSTRSISPLTDHDDRVRFAGVLAFLLLACGLSLAIGLILLQLGARGV